MQPEGWQHVRRVLVVRLDNIGDVIMLGPALRALRCALPEAEITLLVSPAGSQVGPLLPWVDHVLVLRALWQDVSGAATFDPGREEAVVELLRAGGYDAAAIFTSFSQSPYPPAYACYLAGIPIRLGQSREFGGGVLSQWIKPLPDDTHQVDRNLHLLESAGLRPEGRQLELAIPADVQHVADRLLADVGVDPAQPFVVVAPGASAAARRYDPVRYGAVARGLLERLGLPIVVVGSSREADTIAPVMAEARDERVRSLVGRTSVPELAAIVRRAELLIANDSGPMHMADAFRRPMVILYAGTEYESQWGPRSAAHKLLRRPTDCSPCYAFRCPYNMECLDIPPHEVVQEAAVLLARQCSK